MLTATLEITIRCISAQSYIADVHLNSDASDAPPMGITDVPVVFDFDALRAESLNPILYGQLLSTYLFADQRLRAAWFKARGYAAMGLLQIRLRLTENADSLHDLLWETLRDPETDQPLALDGRIRLVRTLTSINPTPILIPPRPKLTALVVVSNPSNITNYGLVKLKKDEIARVPTALGNIPTVILGDHVKSKGRATLDNSPYAPTKRILCYTLNYDKR